MDTKILDFGVKSHSDYKSLYYSTQYVEYYSDESSFGDILDFS